MDSIASSELKRKLIELFIENGYDGEEASAFARDLVNAVYSKVLTETSVFKYAADMIQGVRKFNGNEYICQ